MISFASGHDARGSEVWRRRAYYRGFCDARRESAAEGLDSLEYGIDTVPAQCEVKAAIHGVPASTAEGTRRDDPASHLIWWMRCAFCDAEKGKPHESWCRYA